MLLSDFQFVLPENLIAQQPLEKRESSRMLVVDRASRSLRNEEFLHFPDYLNKGDVLVLNNTKVFPARLWGKSETGAGIEIFLVEEIEDKVWLTLARPARRLHPGKKIFFGDVLSAEVIEKTANGKIIVNFQADGDFREALQEIGKTPLPPYIKRDKEQDETDRERYQTVYAKKSGAIAAPTAGLHFTPQIMDEIRGRGVEIVEITLHVGYGTFEPVRVSELSEHKVSPERFEIEETAAEILNKAKKGARRIVAVGTTTARALESVVSKHGKFTAGKSLADITVKPGYRFLAVDALLTNFHLPQSSLLVLVSTFGGHELIMDSYKHAVISGYRFYSYGDCMLIV
ncbi:MAG: tRNA preQ1(34) S-adenosylmethionine ribosyltransferase-isomerase QueA [Acidobacteriota bacterium]|nr:tRNA preQ1(34) S-adenosylmethionine ribosyltransferase-isomerase QueA [Blastocatellia bacterium]MDQ3491012.1 tRNA preQ1(34) S-adenosylmethionine ribosyltransferase-isomerase QueA [Acidobacteriota bacterium]